MRDERLKIAVKLIEMHLGIYIANEEVKEAEEKIEKRKKRKNKFGNEFAKLDGKLHQNRSEAYEEEFRRIYADLKKKA